MVLGRSADASGVRKKAFHGISPPSCPRFARSPGLVRGGTARQDLSPQRHRAPSDRTGLVDAPDPNPRRAFHASLHISDRPSSRSARQPTNLCQRGPGPQHAAVPAAPPVERLPPPAPPVPAPPGRGRPPPRAPEARAKRRKKPTPATAADVTPYRLSDEAR